MQGRRRHLSGIQPSGLLHLGNYFGAIRKHIEEQDDGFYFIANYHALTTTKDAEILREQTFDVAASYLAFGLDPQRATLFRQSDVPEVCELMWLLMTVTGMGLLERGVSYKEKKDRGIVPSVGLFAYPALQAADILAYDSDVVPVGKDQVQHIEFTRDMAQAFNRAYGDVFKIPEYTLGTPEPVPGIDGQKMSKSYGNSIPIFASGKALKKLCSSIVTDSKELEDVKDPDTDTVFALYSLVASEVEIAEMAANYRAGGYGYGHAKMALKDAIEVRFAEAREKRAYFDSHRDEVEDVLRAGASKARAIARDVTDRARAACGLDAPRA
ncbi:MAG: tryptophan--tRNA ligase [Planctomycetes bacterium]|nr:tryptophan--tRNA ligase [Planctomycetota bacterium]MCB9917966.1 tryptophan--tRNA ligase [Planctomycetota bacterium]